MDASEHIQGMLLHERRNLAQQRTETALAFRRLCGRCSAESGRYKPNICHLAARCVNASPLGYNRVLACARQKRLVAVLPKEFPPNLVTCHDATFMFLSPLDRSQAIDF